MKLRKLGKARITEEGMNPRTQRQRQELYWFMLISVGAVPLVTNSTSGSTAFLPTPSRERAAAVAIQTQRSEFVQLQSVDERNRSVTTTWRIPQVLP